MTKMNYTKVEEALAEGIRQIEANKLLGAADENAAIRAGKQPSSTLPTFKANAIQLKRLTSLHRDLQALEQLGGDPYGHLNLNKEQIKEFLKDPTTLNEEDWKKIKLWKEQIAQYKNLLGKEKTASSDEDLVTRERKQQVTKRFNVNEKWIPLK